MPRHTARGIVVRDDQILLMERHRDGSHYFSFPGGAIEDGESPDTTVVRELKEETDINVSTLRPVIEMRDHDIHHLFYLCEYLNGEPKLRHDSEEFIRSNENNKFNPCWIDISEVAHLPLVHWEPVRNALLEGLENDFSEDLTVVQVGAPG